jgi:hypothetical protein
LVSTIIFSFAALIMSQPNPPGPAGAVFVVTAYLLFLTEALGATLGLYFLREKPSTSPD